MSWSIQTTSLVNINMTGFNFQEYNSRNPYRKLASSASWPSSSIAFLKPIKSSNYLQAKLNDIAKPIWEGSWNHSTWTSLSSQTSMQSLSTKFVIYIILINAIQKFTNKENDKLQRIEKYSYLTMNSNGNMKTFLLIDKV